MRRSTPRLIDLPGGRVRLLPGLTSASQAPVVGAAWEPLAAHLRDLDDAGMDVIVDLGRWAARHGPEPLLPYLDLLLLVTSSDLPGIHAARGWVPVLRAELDTLGRGADALRALVVGPGRPYSTREVGRRARAAGGRGSGVGSADRGGAVARAGAAPQRRPAPRWAGPSPRWPPRPRRPFRSGPRPMPGRCWRDRPAPRRS